MQLKQNFKFTFKLIDSLIVNNIEKDKTFNSNVTMDITVA